MRVLIIEDETTASDNLVEMLREIDPAIEVEAVLESVQGTVEWMGCHTAPDLILMDIHLSDASAFEIFERLTIKVPIVFTTAYDQYAINAFRVNSIDYLLKPVKSFELKRALDKFHDLEQSEIAGYLERMLRLHPEKASYKERFLIPFRDSLIPVPVTDIAFIYHTDKNTQVYLKNGTDYTYSRPLEQIMEELNPRDFFRANKQYIIARDSVRKITLWEGDRLNLTLCVKAPESVLVSKNKASEFKKWIQ